MAWVGLERYGYLEEAQRLAYRFLYMLVFLRSTSDFRLIFLLRMTTAFVDFNGVVPEKVCSNLEDMAFCHVLTLTSSLMP